MADDIIVGRMVVILVLPDIVVDMMVRYCW